MRTRAAWAIINLVLTCSAYETNAQSSNLIGCESVDAFVAVEDPLFPFCQITDDDSPIGVSGDESSQETGWISMLLAFLSRGLYPIAWLLPLG